jgi:hypothetical protein
VFCRACIFKDNAMTDDANGVVTRERALESAIRRFLTALSENQSAVSYQMIVDLQQALDTPPSVAPLRLPSYGLPSWYTAQVRSACEQLEQLSDDRDKVPGAVARHLVRIAKYLREETKVANGEAAASTPATMRQGVQA